ncbi:MAG: energy transducer TonB [Acidobacteriota bacterium]|nr:energy transducer TonB [Acidobacteriota bacterium]
MIPLVPTTLAPRSKIAFGMRRFRVGVVLCILTVLTPLKAIGRVKVTYASGAQVAAMFVKFGHPDYPYEARRARRTGSGIFRVYINPMGQ